MSSFIPNTKRVLFVDESNSFLNMLEKVFGKWSHGTWEMLRAPNSAKALAMIEEQLVDVIVVETELPGVDGIQFIHLLGRRFAAIPKAVLTAKPTPEGKIEALDAGAELYLEKPATIDGMEITFRALDELTKWRPVGGFTGLMWCANLHEILQVECLNQSSAVMEIISGVTRGKVWVRDGLILHAFADHHSGTMALAYLLTMKGGQFSVRPFSEPPEITINGPWEALLMEAAQTRDEEGTAFFKKPAKKDAELENWEKTGVPSLEQALKQSGDTSRTALVREAEDMFVPKTEEVLVCTGKGEVLYEWQCPDHAARLQFIATLQEKARDLTKSLGAFDRVEVTGDDFRVIARAKNENQVYLRVHRLSEMPT